MVNKIYLALYKGTGGSLYDRVTDWLIRKVTKGRYSHCEIVILRHNFTVGEQRPDVVYDCYTSSPRDGGVRRKQINMQDDKWVFIPIDLTEQQVIAYFNRTKGAKYDWWGVLGLVFGIKQKRSKFFCSEWCFNLIFNSQDGWRFNPNQLAAIINGIKNAKIRY